VSGAVKCRECVGEMEKGVFDLTHRFLKKGDEFGDVVFPYYRKNYGFIEIYKEMKKKKE
jgi:hypothetical protein